MSQARQNGNRDGMFLNYSRHGECPFHCFSLFESPAMGTVYVGEGSGAVNPRSERSLDVRFDFRHVRSMFAGKPCRCSQQPTC
jgi:hypothetical protein